MARPGSYTYPSQCAHLKCRCLGGRCRGRGSACLTGVWHPEASAAEQQQATSDYGSAIVSTEPTQAYNNHRDAPSNLNVTPSHHVPKPFNLPHPTSYRATKLLPNQSTSRASILGNRLTSHTSQHGEPATSVLSSPSQLSVLTRQQPSATGSNWEKYQKNYADDEVEEKKITPLSDESVPAPTDV